MVRRNVLIFIKKYIYFFYLLAKFQQEIMCLSLISKVVYGRICCFIGVFGGHIIIIIYLVVVLMGKNRKKTLENNNIYIHDKIVYFIFYSIYLLQVKTIVKTCNFIQNTYIFAHRRRGTIFKIFDRILSYI